MQAHTLGEVGALDTVLLRVSFGTILAIFIEIGSYLTDREQSGVYTPVAMPLVKSAPTVCTHTVRISVTVA